MSANFSYQRSVPEGKMAQPPVSSLYIREPPKPVMERPERERKLVVIGSLGLWDLDKDGLLYHHAKSMLDWTDAEDEYDDARYWTLDVPWYQFREKIKSVFLPDGLTEIGRKSFRNCVNLTEIRIPDSVDRIGPYAFSGCTSLTKIRIPDSVTRIQDYTFYGCISLTEIEIPDSVDWIGSYAFSGCTNLTKIHLPNKGFWVRIDDYAFHGCTSLTQIDIPQNVTYLGLDVFGECKNLQKVTMPSWFNKRFFKFSYGISKKIVTFT